MKPDTTADLILARPPESSLPELDRFYIGDSVELPQKWPGDFVDLTVTSPHYDNLKHYKGYRFDADAMLSAIYRATRPGGVCVWIVGEKINGGRSLSSFRHAFIGQESGFIVRDVMSIRRKTPLSCGPTPMPIAVN